MYQRRKKLTIFGVASIDLFASALGAFVTLTLVSLPFFMNTDKSGRLEPMVERYVQLFNQKENLQQQISHLQQENSQLSIHDMELLLLVDFSNSYASFLDGLEDELRTLTQFWRNRNKRIHVSLILYGDRKTRYPILRANIDPQGDRGDLSELYALLRRIRSEPFKASNNSHLNQDGPEGLHLALEHALNHEWTLPQPQRFVFVHYDNICYPEEMERCSGNLRLLQKQVAALFMKYTQTVTSVDRDKAIALAEESNTTFIDSGQSWTLQIFDRADAL